MSCYAKHTWRSAGVRNGIFGRSPAAVDFMPSFQKVSFIQVLATKISRTTQVLRGKILCQTTLRRITKRADLLKTRHTHEFEIPLPPSTMADLKYPDKKQLREAIVSLRAAGWSYREIGREVGLHWTRVGQILKNKKAGE